MSFAFIDLTQQQHNTPGVSSDNITVATIAVGDLVIVVSECNPTGDDITGVTDSLGNTYAPLAAVVQLPSVLAHLSMRAFYTVATAGGSNPTITASFAGTLGSFNTFDVLRYSHTTGTIVLDGVSTGVQNAAAVPSPVNSGSIVTTGTDLLFGWADWSAGTNRQPPSGWTARTATPRMAADFLNQAAGTKDFKPTYSGTAKWFAIIAAFKEQSSVVLPTPSLLSLGVGA